MIPSVNKIRILALILLSALVIFLGRAAVHSNAAGSSCASPSFAVVLTHNIGNSLFSIAAGDLNGDGKPDVVTGSFYEDKVNILIGNGAGNFTLSGNLTTGTRPSALALGDFNQDGKLDLAVTRDFSTTVSVLLGTGTGTFSAPANFTVGNNPLALVLADFNNDGKLDLATGNDGSNTLSILLGNGAGSFTSAPTVTGIRATTLAAADLNHDGKIDLAAANTNGNKVTIVLGDGSGGFGPANNFDGGSQLKAIAAADFNKDSHLDIAVTNYSDCCTPAFVAILLGNGAGSFGAPVKFSVPAGPYAIAVADYNGDANLDVATANIQQSSSNVAVLLGDGNGALSTATNFNPLAAPWALVTTDVNLDGVPDLIAASPPNVATLLNACEGAPTPTPTPTPTPLPTPTPTPTPAPGDIVISQIYSNGGQIGSTYQTNYIEVFNRSNKTFDIAGWPFSFTSATGEFTFSIGFVSSSGAFIGPGQYLLIQMGPSGGNGAPLPIFPDFSTSNDITSAGKIAFSRPGTFLTGPCPLPNSQVIDFVGYGSAANCFEGTGPVANSSTTTAAIRLAGGCTDTDNNASDFAVGTPVPRNSSSAPNFCSSAPPEIQFSQPRFDVTENPESIGVLVLRSGNTSGTSTVDYTTSDFAGATPCHSVNGRASSRCDYIAQIGTLKFNPGETFKLINIPIIDDTYVEGTEIFFVDLSNPTGATLGAQPTTQIFIQDPDNAPGPNPIDQSSFFVRQHYIDFLNREPDAAGNNFWIGEIENCTPKPQCTEIKRINVSAAFFLSIEFQETGYLAYRAYKAAYGDASGTAPVQGMPVQISVPMIRLQEFIADSHALAEGVVCCSQQAQQILESNKVAYFAAFVLRQRFQTDYPSTMTAAEFVDKLNMKSGNVLSTTERDTLVNQLQSGQKTRAEVLRAVAEDPDLNNAEKNRAFVLMQYFGYLRRNPNDPLDTDYSGYKFWLDKLNQFNGNFVDAEMVKAFINSGEYRRRFGP